MHLSRWVNKRDKRDIQKDRQTDRGSEWPATVVREGAVEQCGRVSETLTDDDRQWVVVDVVEWDGRVTPVTDVQRRAIITSTHTERRLHSIKSHTTQTANDLPTKYYLTLK